MFISPLKNLARKELSYFQNNSVCNELMVILHFHFPPLQPITDDDVDRIALCLRVLAERAPMMQDIFTDKCRNSLSSMLAAKVAEERETQKAAQENRSIKVQPDDPISFLQLNSQSELGIGEVRLTTPQSLYIIKALRQDGRHFGRWHF